MQQQEFNLNEFKKALQDLQKFFEANIIHDPSYRGELDEIVKATKRLQKSTENDKEKNVVLDVLMVLAFMDAASTDEDEDFDDEDFEEDELDEEFEER